MFLPVYVRVYVQAEKQNKNRHVSLHRHSIRTMTKQIRCVNWRIKKSKRKIKKLHSPP